MISTHRRIYVLALKIMDLLCLIMCLFAASSIVHLPFNLSSFDDFLSIRFSVKNFLIMTGFLFAWHYIFSYCNLYSSKRLSGRLDEITDLVAAISLGTLVLLSIKFTFDVEMINLPFLLVFYLLMTATMIAVRLLIRLFLHGLRVNGRNIRHVLFIGINPRSIRLAKGLEAKKVLGYRVIGFMDQSMPRNGGFKESGYRFFGGLGNFTDFIRTNVVDEVFICLPVKTFYQEAADIVRKCEEQGIIIRLMSDLFDCPIARSESTQIGEQPIVTLYTGGMVGEHVVVKRLVDVICSALLLLLISPVMIVVAILIKLYAPGPVFFVQERLGLNKRRFRLYKFRTMSPGADKMQAKLEDLNEVAGPVFKIKNDPRVTPLGNILRKTSIDELPQLFNVLKGDMSLVGPRPLPIRDYSKFEEDWHRRRFSVRPGITCTWQISGRSDISFHRWMELDMEYIDNWSLWLDFKILAGTIPAIFRGYGAW